MSNQFVRRPRNRTMVVANPGAGNDAIFTVPAGVEWEIVSGYFEITTSAVTGEASALIFGYSATSDTMWQYKSPYLIGPGATVAYGLLTGSGYLQSAIAKAESIAIPPLRLMPGDEIYYSWANPAGTVTVTFPALCVRETILGY